MTYSKFAVLVIAAFAAMVSPAFAQQAADAAKTAPTTQSETKTDTNNSSPNDAEAAATAAAIAKANAAAAGGKSATAKPADDAALAKKAKSFGWHAENRRGVTVYCREAPLVGSRFTKKVCGTATQLAVFLEQQEVERDVVRQHGCSGSCGAQ